MKLLVGLTVVLIGLIALSFLMPHTIVRHEVDGYVVLEIHNVLNVSECKAIIEQAKKIGLSTSNVWSYASESGTAVDDKHRSSKTTWLRDDQHAICMKLAKLSERLTGIPRSHQEMLQVAHYDEGGKFNEHYDACVFEDKKYCDKMNNYAGERRATLLIYLNDDFVGGETEFVKLGIKIKPEIGKAILFWNTYEDESLIKQSIHKGCPVENGEKWICTKWSHALPYRMD